jgi:uncharacterized protein (TIGR00375 family)
MNRYYLDLHIHSKYSRAVSPSMDLPHLEEVAKKKGIDVVGTGDFTHPVWRKELKSKLKKAGEGIYFLNKDSGIKFFITGEISCIYTQDGKGHRIHIIVMPSSLEAAEKIALFLGVVGNVKSDGRPILGLSAKKLAEIIWQKDPKALIIPAHVWTPWFSLYGSASGFDSVKEAFGELSSRIYAYETGLSSDPPMNWRIKEARERVLVSNSDAHSPDKLGRELTVIETDQPFDFNLLAEILEQGYQSPLGKIYTVEFYPEEGKYHNDGHRKCKVNLTPAESKKINNICPVCKRPLTIGVLHRVDDLADSAEPIIPKGAKFLYAIPLKELIGHLEGVGPSSKRVQERYDKIIAQMPELKYLLEAPEKDLARIGGEDLAQSVLAMRAGNVERIAGYDGEFGIIKVKADLKKEEQSSLF